MHSEKFDPSERRLLGILVLMNGVEITDALLMTPLAETIQSKFQMTLQQYTTSVGIYGLSAALCGAMVATFMDRFDRKNLILASFAGLLASILATSQAHNYWTCLMARGFAGAFGGITACVVLAIVGDVFPDHRRGKALGLLGSAFAGAAVVGLPLCVAVNLATKSVSASFFAIFLLGLANWVWAFVRLPALRSAQRATTAELFRRMQAIVKNRYYARAFLFVMCLGLGTNCVVPLMAQYMELNSGIAKGNFAWIFLLMGAGSLVTAITVGKWTDHAGKYTALNVLLPCLMVMVAIVTNLPRVSLPVATVVAVLFMAVAVGRLVPAHAILLDLSDDKNRGMFTTVYNSISLLSTSIGPFLAGAIARRSPVTLRLENFSYVGALAIAFSAAALALGKTMRTHRPQP